MILLLIFLSSCSLKEKNFSCLDCHKGYQSFQGPHQIACILCHEGREKVKSKELAHQGLRRSPPADRVFTLCASCHEEEFRALQRTPHYNYVEEVTSLLSAFRLKLKAANLPQLITLSKSNLSEREAKILDFLGKRCFTCHIFTSGENYPATRRGEGCLSCHRAHIYTKPSQRDCLSCHYSIRIGIDFLGQTPHNWFLDYRSPFLDGRLPERLYGLEYHPLQADVHAKAGLTCLNCHDRKEIMLGQRRASCLICHGGLLQKKEALLFHSPKVLKKVSCAVCHAQYLNQDELKICELITVKDLEKLEEFAELSVQESAEVERFFEAWERSEQVSPVMTDHLINAEKEGLWLCYLENRTFERLNLARGKGGKICLLRKEKIKLKLGQEVLIADLSQCKFPHTIGRGDFFRSYRILKGLTQKP